MAGVADKPQRHGPRVATSLWGLKFRRNAAPDRLPPDSGLWGRKEDENPGTPAP